MKKSLPAAAALLFVLAVAAPLRAASPAVALPDTATAQKMVDDFAPWISAIIQQRFGAANRLFPLERPAQAEVESSANVQIFSRFTRLDDTTLSLVGVHILGDHIGTALFTAATEHGPVAFKISYYRYGTDTHVGKIEIVEHWSDIEALSLTVDALPAPVTALLQSRPN
ncbi:MAG TPA: hypothetical protein VM008_18870 [Phycisphaerae bacterium]|nr:hypothetical protein [Phycisphaerae bacterium]